VLRIGFPQFHIILQVNELIKLKKVTDSSENAKVKKLDRKSKEK